MSNKTPFPLGAFLNSPDGTDPSAETAYQVNYNSFVQLMGTAPAYIDSYIDYGQPISDWVSNASFQAWSTAVTPGASNAIPVIGLPMASTAAGSETPDQFFKDFASGKYDSVINSSVEAWAVCGFKTQYWRPGWEFNLSSSASFATSDPQTQSDWIAAFQHIYTELHQSAQQYGVNLQVLWNPSETNWSNAGSTLGLYPGNNYTDCIAVDVYADMYPYSLYDWGIGKTDTSFQQWAANPLNVEHYLQDPAATQWTLDGSGGRSISLAQLISLAKQDGKPIAIAEAGAGNSAGGTDNTDDPAFVNWLAAELRSSNVTVEFVNIWDSNAGGSYEFSQAGDGKPNEAAAWAADFGAGAPSGPQTPTVAITAQTLAQDTGASATDLVTSIGAVTLAGTVSGYNGMVVEVLDGTTLLGNATVTGSGTWSYTTTLAAGSHSLYALAIDPLFETATSDTQPTITVETTPPTVAISSQNFTQATGAVALTGTLAGASGTTVEIVDGTSVLGNATLNNNGGWSYSTVLSSGSHTLHALAVDLAGNSGVSANEPQVVGLDGFTVNGSVITVQSTPALIASDEAIFNNAFGTSYNLSFVIADVAAADATSIAAQPNVTSLTVSDTANDVLNNITALQSITPQVLSIYLTDGGTPLLATNEAAFLDNLTAFNKIVSAHTVQVLDVRAADAPVVLSQPNVTSISIDATVDTIQANLGTWLQDQHSQPVAVINIADGASIVGFSIAGTLSGYASILSPVVADYSNILDRQVDPAGLISWASQLADGMPIWQLRADLATSPEAQSDLEGLYQTVLGRSADLGGLAGWTGLLGTNLSLAEVRADLATAPEAQSDLEGLYQTVLGRSADLGGLAGWTSLLGTNLSLADVRADLATSPEAQSDLEGLYQTVLGRSADLGGLAGWTGLLSTRLSLANIRTDLATSVEAQGDLTAIFRNVEGRPPGIAELMGTEGLLAANGASLGSVEASLSHNGPSGFATITPSTGNATVAASAGPEVFDFTSIAFGYDTITGFNAAQDTIALTQARAENFATLEANITGINGGALITLDASHSILLSGVAPSSLAAPNFRFV
ncbi:MAG: hypothetical protein JO001_24955 [Alphaproteobacteria bacterium]|nr:hypothetical protein [Alphaproteobacteria bacterium]